MKAARMSRLPDIKSLEQFFGTLNEESFATKLSKEATIISCCKVENEVETVYIDEVIEVNK